MDWENDDIAFVAGGFIFCGIIPFFLATLSCFLTQPVILPPIEISGKPGTFHYYAYPTGAFPRFCLYPRLLDGMSLSETPLNQTIMENVFIFQMPEEKTQVLLSYACNPSFYNATTLLSLHPEKPVYRENELLLLGAIFGLITFFIIIIMYLFVRHVVDEDTRMKRRLLK